MTSWGTTTRLVGAVIASHGDERGLILPPKIAPIQVVIVPILRKDTKDQVLEYVAKMEQELKAIGITVKVDADETQSPGAKFYEWELKGVPLRFEIGARDIASGVIIAVSRLEKEKETVSAINITEWTTKKLDSIQQQLFERARKRYQSMWHKEEKFEDFKNTLEQNNGIYQLGWCQDHTCEVRLKEISGSIRCMIESKELTKCFGCGNPSLGDVIAGRSY